MPRIKSPFNLANAADWIGSDIAVSDWVEITQDEIIKFGNLTRHFHWLHMDPVRANLESSFGGTIAQGFLVLDYIIYFTDLCGLRPADSNFSLNYGLDKVRFLQPIPVGNGFRIRDRIGISEVLQRKDRRTLIKTTHEIEVEDLDGVAVYAEWLSLWIPKSKN